MRIKFLVLLAVFCLSIIVVSAHDGPHGPGDEATTKKPKKPKDPKPEEEPEVFEFEDVQIVKRKKQVEVAQNKTKKVEVKKETKKVPKPHIPCSERLVKQKEDCEKSSTAEWKAVFTFEECDECLWKCDYQEIVNPNPPKKETKKVIVKKSKKEVQDAKGIKPKKEKKECSGEQVFRFSNCMVKLRGLVAFGGKTKNFDKKFEKLLNKKKKKDKGAKKGKNAKKNNGKKPAAKPAAEPPKKM